MRVVFRIRSGPMSRADLLSYLEANPGISVGGIDADTKGVDFGSGITVHDVLREFVAMGYLVEARQRYLVTDLGVVAILQLIRSVG